VARSYLQASEGEEEEGGRKASKAFYPAVGALLGLAAGACFTLVSTLTTHALAAVAAIATLALLTGGLHLDGLADATDGLLGGNSRERRLEIMRDSSVGAFAVVALAIVLGGDAAALAGLPAGRALVALVVAGALSRLAMLGVIAALPSARPTGLGASVQGGRRVFDLSLGAALTAAACLLDWRRALIAAAMVTVTAAGVGALARRRIGGATGDVYGATAELCQLAALAAFAVRI
jgi:adenosylcobinamide-GDP ribazoletransferase